MSEEGSLWVELLSEVLEASLRGLAAGVLGAGAGVDFTGGAGAGAATADLGADVDGAGSLGSSFSFAGVF